MAIQPPLEATQTEDMDWRHKPSSKDYQPEQPTQQC